eukprot:6867380-Alexandrium_andersonii.AAC.1
MGGGNWTADCKPSKGPVSAGHAAALPPAGSACVRGAAELVLRTSTSAAAAAARAARVSAHGVGGPASA